MRGRQNSPLMSIQACLSCLVEVPRAELTHHVCSTPTVRLAGFDPGVWQDDRTWLLYIKPDPTQPTTLARFDTFTRVVNRLSAKP